MLLAHRIDGCKNLIILIEKLERESKHSEEYLTRDHRSLTGQVANTNTNTNTNARGSADSNLVAWLTRLELDSVAINEVGEFRLIFGARSVLLSETTRHAACASHKEFQTKCSVYTVAYGKRNEIKRLVSVSHKRPCERKIPF